MKTSNAKIYTARLNPINPQEKAVMEIIESHKGQYNFKQVIVDAILRCSGFTPEMFAPTRDQQTTAIINGLSKEIEGHLSHIVQQILNDLRESGVSMPAHIDDKPDDDSISPFAMNFAKGYLKRQQQAQGSTDQDDE